MGALQHERTVMGAAGLRAAGFWTDATVGSTGTVDTLIVRCERD